MSSGMFVRYSIVFFWYFLLFSCFTWILSSNLALSNYLVSICLCFAYFFSISDLRLVFAASCSALSSGDATLVRAASSSFSILRSSSVSLFSKYCNSYLSNLCSHCQKVCNSFACMYWLNSFFSYNSIGLLTNSILAMLALSFLRFPKYSTLVKPAGWVLYEWIFNGW